MVSSAEVDRAVGTQFPQRVLAVDAADGAGPGSHDEGVGARAAASSGRPPSASSLGASLPRMTPPRYLSEHAPGNRGSSLAAGLGSQ